MVFLSFILGDLLLASRALDATRRVGDCFQAGRRNPRAAFAGNGHSCPLQCVQRRFNLLQGFAHAAKQTYRQVLLNDFAGTVPCPARWLSSHRR